MATFAEPDRSRKRDPRARDDRKTSAVQRRGPSIDHASPQHKALRHLTVMLNGGPRATAHRRLAQMIQPGNRVVQGVFLDTAKIGLELTFENDQTADYFTNDGIPSGMVGLAKTWWNRTQKAWSAAAGTPATDRDEEVNVETKSESNKNFGGNTGELDNTIVEYRLTSESEKPDWWWRLSVDPGVVEIQTAPVSASQLADTNPRAAAPAAAAAGVVPPAAAGGAPPALAGAGGPPVAGGLVAPAAAGVAAPAAAGVAAPAAAGVVPLTAAAEARAARARRAAARAHAAALAPRYTPNDIGKIINQHIYGGAANLTPPLSPGGGGGSCQCRLCDGLQA